MPAQCLTFLFLLPIHPTLGVSLSSLIFQQKNAPIAVLGACPHPPLKQWGKEACVGGRIREV